MARSSRVIARWLKRQMPKTLFGRSLLIIVLPVAIMQIAVTYVFFDAHWQTVTARLSEGLAGDIAWAVESYKEDPSPESFARLSQRAEESMSLSVALQPGRKLPLNRRDPPVLFEPFFAPIDRSLNRALTDRLELARGSVDPSGRAVDVQVTRLRRKIEDDPKTPRYLQTVRGVGYRLAPD